MQRVSRPRNAFHVLARHLAVCLLPAALGLLAGANARAEQPRPLSLAQAIDEALNHNPDLRLSALALSGAEAQLEVAAARPNPTLTVQAFGINPRAGIGAGPLRDKTVDTTLRVDQVVERGGKRELRIAGAAGQQQAARHDLREARRRLRQAVSVAYYDLLAAGEKLAVARESAQLFDRTVRAAELRRSAGDLAGADVVRARIDAARARNDAAQAESDILAMQQALLMLMGRSDDANFTVSDRWPGGPPPLMRLDAAALAQRPEVMAAKARLDAARSAQKLALAARHADVTVGIQAEHYPASAANPQGSGNSFGIALQLPLMVRYAFSGEIRAADVSAESARENLDKVLAAARSEALLANAHARASFERVSRYDDELLPLARRAADAAEYAFARGALGIMDLLDVRRAYRSAQLEALAARAEYAKSLAPSEAAIFEEETR